jgi:hypothetical protein
MTSLLTPLPYYYRVRYPTSHETVQAPPKLGTSKKHPQCATVPLQEQREHRHPQDIREIPTQRVNAKPAERRDECSDTASFINIARGNPMEIKSRYFVQACVERCKVRPKLPDQDAARARETGLLTDNIANGSSNTYAVQRWHMLAAALIFG